MKRVSITVATIVLAACTRTEAADSSAVIPSASVGPQLGPAMDEVISDRVREGILSDRTLGTESGRIGVSTKNGIVTLSGSVRDDSRRKSVAVLVRSVGSVVDVVNRLVVDADPTAPETPMETSVERAVSDRVRAAVQADSTLAPDASRVRVSTQGGIVKLSGAVSTPSARNRATIVASAVGGVVRVENELAVGQ